MGVRGAGGVLSSAVVIFAGHHQAYGRGSKSSRRGVGKEQEEEEKKGCVWGCVWGGYVLVVRRPIMEIIHDDKLLLLLQL